MKASKSVALAVLALAIVSTSGCARHSTSEVYYLIASDMALPYWQTAAAGFNKAAAEFKVTAKVAGPRGHDPQAELAALHDAIAAKPSGILISVSDVTVLQPEIDAAINAGIPVITMDSDAPGSRRLFFIGTNNLEAGRLGGERVIQKLGGSGNVGLLHICPSGKHRRAAPGLQRGLCHPARDSYRGCGGHQRRYQQGLRLDAGGDGVDR